MTAIFILLGLIAICVGLLGTIYPAIPGLGLMFGGAWLLAYAGDYQIYGTNTLIFLAVVAAIGTAMDYVAGALGAKYTGASKTAVWGALIGGIVGAFFFHPRTVVRPAHRRGCRRILGTPRYVAGGQSRTRDVYRLHHRYGCQNRLCLDDCDDPSSYVGGKLVLT